MRTGFVIILVLLLGMVIGGCGGGDGVSLVVGNIIGPTSVAENSTGDYAITASGDTGITYLWAVDPSAAGVITGGTTSTITFEPNLVTSNTDVTLQVVVESDNAGPETETLDISITDVAAVSSGWAVTWGGPERDWSGDILVASSGDLYSVGRFQGTSDFMPGLGVAELTSNGADDAYLAKYDSEGELLWAVAWGGPDFDYAWAVAEDSTGNVYVIGGFRDMVDFDPGSGVTSVFGEMNTDVYMSMFDSDGNFVWVRTWGGTGIDTTDAILIDDSDHIWVAGGFMNVVDFDPGAGIESRTSNGDMDAYINMFNSSGTFNDVLTWGGTGYDGCTELALDGSGNIYAGGFFRDTVDFDPGAGTANLVSYGDADAYLSVFNSAGEILWAQTWGGIVFDSSRGIVIDGSGNILVTGVFSDTVDFDPGAASDPHLSNGSMDVYLTIFNSSGDFQAVYTWGGGNSDVGDNVVIDSSGDIYVSGGFSDSVDFDPGPGTKTEVSAGFDDFFLSKFDSSFNLEWVQTWGGGNNDESMAMVLDSYGNVFMTGFYSDSVDFDPGPGVDEHTSTGGADDNAFIMKILEDGLWE